MSSTNDSTNKFQFVGVPRLATSSKGIQSKSTQLQRPALLSSRQLIGKRPSNNTIINPTQRRESLEKRSKTAHLPEWNVSDDLPAVPPFYHLERTTTIVVDTPPKEVARRIVSCLRSMSAVGNYRDMEAHAHIHTLDHVQLYIQLYKDTDIKRNGVLVEVQRKNDCSFAFHQACRSILRAAKGETDSSIRTEVSSYEVCMALLQDDDEDLEQEMTFAMEIADGLLRKDRLDANKLGMESLVLLTDVKSTTPSRASFAARAIFMGSVKDRFLEMLAPSDYDDDDQNNLERCFTESMHNHALTVLANALNVMESTLHEVMSVDMTDFIMPILVEELKKADTMPHDAYQAARSLLTLMRNSPELMQRAVDLGVPAVAELSQGVGHCRHELLATVSDDILSVFDQVKLV